VLEVQDIFRQYGGEYLEAQNPPTHVWKAAKAIGACRTAELGGHVDVCDECGYQKASYNSCRNRHSYASDQAGKYSDNRAASETGHHSSTFS